MLATGRWRVLSLAILISKGGSIMRPLLTTIAVLLVACSSPKVSEPEDGGTTAVDMGTPPRDMAFAIDLAVPTDAGMRRDAAGLDMDADATGGTIGDGSSPSDAQPPPGEAGAPVDATTERDAFTLDAGGAATDAGASCGPCPSPPANAQTTCSDAGCGFQCEDGFRRCGPGCTPLDSPDACGDSCTRCPQPSFHGVASCVDDACAIICDPGFLECGSQCVDPLTDVTNCGGCGRVCGSLGCAEGECIRPVSLQAVTDATGPETLLLPYQSWMLAQLSDGTWRSWGRRPRVVVPIPSVSLTDFSTADRYGCGVTDDGRVACFGLNVAGNFGDGTTDSRTGPSLPAFAIGVSTARAVSCGRAHTCTLLEDGTVRCSGSNGWGELGDGTRTDRHSPVSSSGVTDAIQVVAHAGEGGATCALRRDGTVLCWGTGILLGDGSGMPFRTSAAPVSGIDSATYLCMTQNYGACALLSDGRVRCWGRNLFHGQLGDGTTVDRLTPVDVVGLVDAQAIACGQTYVCALRADMSVVCWGSNGAGELGDGSTTTRTTPVAVVGLTNVRAIAAGDSVTCALRTDDAIMCWGISAGLGYDAGAHTSMPTLPVEW